MTRAQSVAHWSDVPSLSHLWMAALLRLAAMLVSNAASVLRMRPSRLPGECHADATPATLPPATRGNQIKDNKPAAATSPTPEALMLSRPRSGRRVYPELVEGSNHEGELTVVRSPLIPAKAWGEERSAKRTKRTAFRATNARSASAGREGSPRSLFRRKAAAQSESQPSGLSWIPAFAGTSGTMSGTPRP
jgi:hypothetical protein